MILFYTFFEKYLHNSKTFIYYTIISKIGTQPSTYIQKVYPLYYRAGTPQQKRHIKQSFVLV